MKRSSLVIALLVFLLVASNLAWLYVVVDQGVSLHYSRISSDEARGAAIRTMAALAEASKPGATRQSIIDVTARAVPGSVSEPFDKDGYVWIGEIGLRFDEAGKLVDAKPSVDPF